MRTTRPLRILIVDDYAPLRGRVLELLRGAFPDAILLEASSGEAALDMIAAGPAPDIVLMDIRLPGMNGFAATRRVMEIAPATRVIMLTLHNGAQHRREAEAAGAIGYVLKRAAAEELVTTIRQNLPEEAR